MKKISLNLNGMTKVMSEMELKHVVGGAYGNPGGGDPCDATACKWAQACIKGGKWGICEGSGADCACALL